MLGTHDPPRLRVGFLCKSISMIRVLECSLGVPSSRFVFAFFIVFGGSTMSARRQLVLLRGFPVCVVHGCHRCAAAVAAGMSALGSPDEAISWAAGCFNKYFAR